MRINKILPILPLFLIFSLANCAAPSPLYGIWADNKGNQITFIADNTFTAKITNSSGVSVMYNGSYTALVNALTFVIEPESTRIVTEWDIRGNMLYLTWVNSVDDEISLTLYKIA